MVTDLFEAPQKFKVDYAIFNFLESHVGKSSSDSIGSIVKCALVRGMLISEQGVMGIGDILDVILSESLISL